MWEISIEMPIKFKRYLVNIENYLLEKYKDLGIFMALAKKQNSFVLSLAVNLPNNKFKQDIKLQISETIILSEKEDFFKTKFNCENLSDSCKDAFINALIMFNFEEEILYVSSLLDIDKNVITHAFFVFKLKELMLKWQELLYISSQQILYNTPEILFEFLRFLVSNINSKYEKVEIVKRDKKYLINDDKNNTIKNDKIIDATDEIELITNLIILSPKQIIIDIKLVSNEMVSLLKYIFDERLIIEV